jgi:hypothetical protein
MTTFDNKEKGSVGKFAHDQEVEFRIHAHRNKLLGLWVAAKLGISGSEAEKYAKSVATSDLCAAHHDEKVLEKIKDDLAAKGINISEHDIKAEMYRLLKVSKQEVTAQ